MGGRETSGRVCVIHTGGTIGMRSITPELQPDLPVMLRPDELESFVRKRSDLAVEYHFKPLLSQGDDFRPIVSSQIGPQHWIDIARTIEHHYDTYDGFVVLHGTDTMAWTASALSFMFANLAKPVVLTGSQRPLLPPHSDAIPNFVNAVMLAGRGDDSIPLIPEVVICFDDLILRGNRATKVSAGSLKGFESPNAPPLGRVGRRVAVDVNEVRTAPERSDSFYLRTGFEREVVDVALHPGMSPDRLEASLRGAKGVILRTFGAGNAPGDLQPVISAFAREAVVVNVTQCLEGTVEAGMVIGSRALTDCGVVSGLDLTGESALTKLMLLLGSEPPDVARRLIQLDQRGEQSTDFVELHARAREAERDGVQRLVLTDSLHARVRGDRLAHAALRLRAVDGRVQGPPGEVRLHLNHWKADRESSRDVRYLGECRFVHATENGAAKDVVVDVTDVCRDVLEAGSPVTLTVVPAGGAVQVEAFLSLFVDRRVAPVVA